MAFICDPSFARVDEHHKYIFALYRCMSIICCLTFLWLVWWISGMCTWSCWVVCLTITWREICGGHNICDHCANAHISWRVVDCWAWFPLTFWPKSLATRRWEAVRPHNDGHCRCAFVACGINGDNSNRVRRHGWLWHHNRCNGSAALLHGWHWCTQAKGSFILRILDGNTIHCGCSVMFKWFAVKHRKLAGCNRVLPIVC